MISKRSHFYLVVHGGWTNRSRTRIVSDGKHNLSLGRTPLRCPRIKQIGFLCWFSSRDKLFFIKIDKGKSRLSFYLIWPKENKGKSPRHRALGMPKFKLWFQPQFDEFWIKFCTSVTCWTFKTRMRLEIFLTCANFMMLRR